MKAGNWEAGIHSVLGRDVSVGPHGMSILVPCQGGCGEIHTIELRGSAPPQGIRRNMEHAGWRLARRRACPNCNAATPPKEETTVKDQPTLSVVPTPPAPPAAPAASPTDAARAVRRAVIQWLEEAYDVGKSAYRAGVTDDSIAKETGAAVALVKQLREENYGPLAEPPELAEMRLELAAIQREGREARESMDTKLSALNGRATVLEQKLQRVSKANGWPL